MTSEDLLKVEKKKSKELQEENKQLKAQVLDINVLKERNETLKEDLDDYQSELGGARSTVNSFAESLRESKKELAKKDKEIRKLKKELGEAEKAWSYLSLSKQTIVEENRQLRKSLNFFMKSLPDDEEAIL